MMHKENKAKIIELIDVCKQFDGVSVVENMNLYVRKGEFITFLGPSGCGKTTTLRMIAGFDMPTSGQILLNGEDISALHHHIVPFVVGWNLRSVERGIDHPLKLYPVEHCLCRRLFLAVQRLEETVVSVFQKVDVPISR